MIADKKFVNEKVKGMLGLSRDLAFWKYTNGKYLDHKEVYLKACCNGEEMAELEPIPIEKILKTVAETFSHWNCLDKYNYENEEDGAFEIFTTQRIVRFDCYGMTNDDMNLLIDIMTEFDCPLYDPQIEERFDGENNSF